MDPTPIPEWLDDSFTIHIIMHMVNRATERLIKAYPNHEYPSSIYEPERTAKFRVEIFNVLKVYLDSEFMEDDTKKHDHVYEEWKKVKIAEGLYKMIISDLEKVMMDDSTPVPALFSQNMITHLWTINCRDEMYQTKYSLEYPDDPVEYHPIFTSLRMRLEKPLKYKKYMESYQKILKFTKDFLQASYDEGSIEALNRYNTTYTLGL